MAKDEDKSPDIIKPRKMVICKFISWTNIKNRSTAIKECVRQIRLMKMTIPIGMSQR